MAVIELESPDDARLADYAATADPALARERGLFVVEGRLVVARLIEARRYAIHSVFVSDAARRALGAVLDALDPRTPVYVGPTELFRHATGYNIHRGCLALAVRPPATEPLALARQARTAVVLEAVANPDNVGGVFRNAAAFGVDAVFLCPSTSDPLYRKAIRTSMGATLRVPFARIDDWPGGLSRLREAEFRLVALTPRADAPPLDEYVAGAVPARLALLVGNEGIGLSEEVVARADDRIRIPIHADVDSLNVAVAAGIALARLTRLTPAPAV
jgi:tRNA G18 (ribose-2'-O)-methylase SpoU